MPHSRKRYAGPLLRQTLLHSPITGIIGQRQTGKTTLAEAVCGDYATLDLPDTMDLAEADPVRFLRSRKRPFAIDECQLSPALFPALKDHVRVHPGKGQFILTGSVRFTSRKAIRESLTGRIVNLELLPLSPAEAHSEPLPARLIEWIRSRDFPDVPQAPFKWLRQMDERFNRHLASGGLPGICFYREQHVRSARFETQLETLLERDIRLLVNTPVPYRQLRALLGEIAIGQGLPLNFATLGRKVGISIPTVKRLIGAMEGMFLLRSIASEQQSSPVLFLEDQGMATHLIGDRADPTRDLLRGLFASVYPQFSYRPETTPVFYQYRTRGGARVDLVVKTRLGTVGIIPVNDEEATPSSIASARSFLARTSPAKVVIAHRGTGVFRPSENVLAVPYPYLISDSI